MLLILTIMHTMSKRRGWTTFNVARTAICLIIAVGLALTCFVTVNPAARTVFMASPWLLPTITLSYLAVLVLTHVPHPPGGKSGAGSKQYQEVGEHKAPPPGDAAKPSSRPRTREQIYGRGHDSSPSDDEDDEDHDYDDEGAEGARHRRSDYGYETPYHRQLRAERRARMAEEGGDRAERPSNDAARRQHLREDSAHAGGFDDSRINRLSQDIERMITTTPSPPDSPPRDHRHHGRRE